MLDEAGCPGLGEINPRRTDLTKQRVNCRFQRKLRGHRSRIQGANSSGGQRLEAFSRPKSQPRPGCIRLVDPAIAVTVQLCQIGEAITAFNDKRLEVLVIPPDLLDRLKKKNAELQRCLDEPRGISRLWRKLTRLLKKPPQR